MRSCVVELILVVLELCAILSVEGVELTNFLRIAKGVNTQQISKGSWETNPQKETLVGTLKHVKK